MQGHKVSISLTLNIAPSKGYDSAFLCFKAVNTYMHLVRLNFTSVNCFTLLLYLQGLSS